MADWVLGVLGGSGVYDIDGLERVERRRLEGPWGPPSDELLCGEIEGVRLVFLPRHGRGHRLSPTGVNARANIDALKRAGCTDVLSLSAVGSLREDLAPGTFVVVDHVSLADPVCPRLSALAAEAARGAGAPVVGGGTYLVMEGPQFSTRAESELYRSWGCAVIGMTNMPEAKLAREAELPYASICMVTDYDCWRDDHENVEVGHILEVLRANAAKARETVLRLARSLKGPRAPSPIDRALDHALITAPEARDPALVAKLDAVAGRVLKV
jgi:5'-methylthioadenosine phosphorylase